MSDNHQPNENDYLPGPAQASEAELKQWLRRDADDARPISEGLWHGPFDPREGKHDEAVMHVAENDPQLYQLLMLRKQLVDDMNSSNLNLRERIAPIYEENWSNLRRSIIMRRQELANPKK